jgi:hypothetical protein
MGWLKYLLRKLRGEHETHAPPPAASELPADDFVARYGLSYGQAADPVSYNAKVEVAKALRKPNGRAR